MDSAIGVAVQRLVTESTLLVLFLVLSDIVLLLTIRWLATERKEARQSHIGSLEKHAEVAERSATSGHDPVRPVDPRHGAAGLDRRAAAIALIERAPVPATPAEDSTDELAVGRAEQDSAQSEAQPQGPLARSR